MLIRGISKPSKDAGNNDRYSGNSATLDSSREDLREYLYLGERPSLDTPSPAGRLNKKTLSSNRRKELIDTSTVHKSRRVDHDKDIYRVNAWSSSTKIDAQSRLSPPTSTSTTRNIKIRTSSKRKDTEDKVGSKPSSDDSIDLEKMSTEREVRKMMSTLMKGVRVSKEDIAHHTPSSDPKDDHYNDSLTPPSPLLIDEEIAMNREEAKLQQRAEQLRLDAEKLNERKMILRLKNLQQGLQAKADEELDVYKKEMESVKDKEISVLFEEKQSRLVALCKFQGELEEKIKHLQQLCNDVITKKDLLEKGFKDCIDKIDREHDTKLNTRRQELKVQNTMRLREAASAIGYAGSTI